MGTMDNTDTGLHTMYLNKAKRNTLETMVLAVRVAVRAAERKRPEGGSEWLEASSIETVNEYALALALGDKEKHRAAFINDMLEHAPKDSELYLAAYVATLRLADMGVQI